ISPFRSRRRCVCPLSRIRSPIPASAPVAHQMESRFGYARPWGGACASARDGRILEHMFVSGQGGGGMGQRRDKGTGMIRRRADGRWEGRLDLGFLDGKRVRRSVYGATEREVRTKLRELAREVE